MYCHLISASRNVDSDKEQFVDLSLREKLLIFFFCTKTRTLHKMFSFVFSFYCIGFSFFEVVTSRIIQKRLPKLSEAKPKKAYHDQLSFEQKNTTVLEPRVNANVKLLQRHLMIPPSVTTCNIFQSKSNQILHKKPPYFSMFFKKKNFCLN